MARNGIAPPILQQTGTLRRTVATRPDKAGPAGYRAHRAVPSTARRPITVSAWAVPVSGAVRTGHGWLSWSCSGFPVTPRPVEPGTHSFPRRLAILGV